MAIGRGRRGESRPHSATGGRIRRQRAYLRHSVGADDVAVVHVRLSAPSSAQAAVRAPPHEPRAHAHRVRLGARAGGVVEVVPVEGAALDDSLQHDGAALARLGAGRRWRARRAAVRARPRLGVRGVGRAQQSAAIARAGIMSRATRPAARARKRSSQKPRARGHFREALCV